MHRGIAMTGRVAGEGAVMGLSYRLSRLPSFRAAMARLMALFRRLLLLRARDETKAFEHAPALILAPHPDDETLGCGATILRKTAAGVGVRVVIVTDGRNSHRSRLLDADTLARLRRDEALAACAVLGVPADSVHFLDYPDGSLATAGERLIADLRRLIGEGPGAEDVLMPSAHDGHPDHRALNAAVRRAVLSAGRSSPRLYEYPVWFWDVRSWVDRDARPWRQVGQLLVRPLMLLARSRPLTVSAEGLLERKREAILAYRSQTRNLTGEPGWAVLDEAFLRHFLQTNEIFFPVCLPPNPEGPK
jgi:LmbE family N-acetylglucosaminyl deacetylase